MATKKTDDEVLKQFVGTIPRIRRQILEVRISGLSPLIVHRFAEETMDDVESDQTGQKSLGPKPIRNPEAEYEASRYLNSQGVDCIPALAVKRSMVNAVIRFISKGQMTGTQADGLFFVLGDLLPIKSDPPYMRRDRVRYKGTTMDLRYRPCYENGSVDLQIEFRKDIITPENIIEILNTAGFQVGILEWRPDKHGPFGRFEVAQHLDTGLRT